MATTDHDRLDHPPLSRRIRVCLATPWDTACGIAEHSRMLKAAVEAADPGIELLPTPGALNPHTNDVWGYGTCGDVNVLHLNYQAALHARWTPEQVGYARLVWPTLVTYHDTGVPNSDSCKAVIAAADAAVVHEPFDDLPAEKTHYWRMGVPKIEDHRWFGYLGASSQGMFPGERPYLGTVGFPFPWKCYDELCQVTARVGWGLLLLAPTATEADRQRWTALNPHVVVVSDFLPGDEVIARLRACDATAFTYVCHNTGQSGAILQGIATRKPVIALRTCRQMRALALDPLGECAIHWAETFEDVERLLTWGIPIQRLDPGIVALATQESWVGVGRKYARLYRQLVEARS